MFFFLKCRFGRLSAGFAHLSADLGNLSAGFPEEKQEEKSKLLGKALRAVP